MRKWLVIAGFMGLFVTSALAADYPKAEVFGGFQYSGSEGGVNAAGWNFSVTGNLKNYYGITADLASGYWSQGGVSYSNYTYTFGPVMQLRTKKAYTPFVHALLGGDHASAGVGNVSVSGNGFAFMAGGGVDANVNRRIAVRIPQVDWLLVHNSGGTSAKNVRISFGLVLKF